MKLGIGAAAPPAAEVNFYVRYENDKLNPDRMADKFHFKSPIVSAVAIGTELNKSVTLQLEASNFSRMQYKKIYRNQSVGDIPFESQAIQDVSEQMSLTATRFLLGSSYRFFSDSRLRPYLGIGLGIGLNKLYDIKIDFVNCNFITPGDTVKSFVWKAEAGLEHKVSDSFSILAWYDCNSIGKFQSKASADIKTIKSTGDKIAQPYHKTLSMGVGFYKNIFYAHTLMLGGKFNF